MNATVPTFTFRRAENPPPPVVPVAPSPMIVAPAVQQPVEQPAQIIMVPTIVEAPMAQPIAPNPNQVLLIPAPRVFTPPADQTPVQPPAPQQVFFDVDTNQILAIPAPTMMVPDANQIQVAVTNANPVMPEANQNQVLVLPAPRVFVPVAFQPPITPPPAPITGTPPAPIGDDNLTLRDLGIEIEPPTTARLYRLETEAALKRRVAAEIKSRPTRGSETEKVEFPSYRALSEKPFEPRVFGGVIKQIEPNYVIYGRLYGEEVNSERYGWDLGAIQPLVSTSVALKDMALLPYNFAARPCQRFETSAGRCYPGDPVPYLIYPMEISATGTAWEAVIIGAGFALIP